MPFEPQLQELLKQECPNVFLTVADEGAATPYVVFQQVGGDSLTFHEGHGGAAPKPSEKNARVQVACWAKDQKTASTLARKIEDRLTGAAAVAILKTEVLGALVGDYDPDTKLRGARQDFSVWFGD